LFRLAYTAAGRRDLSSIFNYIARESGSLETDRRFTSQIREKCKNLASLPATMGRARPELRQDIRSFALRGYVIFFRYRGEVLEVANVLEGHRDIDSLFGSDDAS
jgi:toxin ParE1/3/4